MNGASRFHNLWHAVYATIYRLSASTARLCCLSLLAFLLHRRWCTGPNHALGHVVSSIVMSVPPFFMKAFTLWDMASHTFRYFWLGSYLSLCFSSSLNALYSFKFHLIVNHLEKLIVLTMIGSKAFSFESPQQFDMFLLLLRMMIPSQWTWSSVFVLRNACLRKPCFAFPDA